MLQLPATLSCLLAMLSGRGEAAEAEQVAAVHAKSVRDLARRCWVLSGWIIRAFGQTKPVFDHKAEGGK